LLDSRAALWRVLEALPVRRSYLLVRPTWSLTDPGHRGYVLEAIDTMRERFEHLEPVILANELTEVELLKRAGRSVLHCSPSSFIRDDLYFPVPGRAPVFDAIYDAKWADYKRHELAAEITSLALIAYPLHESCTVEYFKNALEAVAHASWFTNPWIKD